MPHHNENPSTGLGFNNKSGYLYGSQLYNRHHNLFRNYGITLSEWEELFDLQGNVCAICGTDKPRGKNWHTDHIHGSPLIRGILCGWCNTAIGKLQEDSDLMLRAIAYLRKDEIMLNKLIETTEHDLAP